MDEITSRIAEFVYSTKYVGLPAYVVQRIKEIVLDSIGCALGAYVTNRAKIAIELADSFGEKPEATIIGYKKASCNSASFVNGELINCLDYDVLGPIGGHVVPFALPPALALSEKMGRSGKDFITSLAISLEVGGRALASVCDFKIPKKEPPYYEPSPRFSYTSAIFGAVAGACKTLDMKPDMIRSALGIGGTSTPVPGQQKWQHLGEGANVNIKYGCWSGWVAMLGTVAAVAAQKGLAGDPSILDGKYGYWQMYGSPFFLEDALVGELGKEWHFEKMNFKYYPACYIDHTSIEAIETLVRENHISPENIDELTVYGDSIMMSPNRLQTTINNNEDAQFTHAYLFALAACRKSKPGPEWQLPDLWNDSQIKNLMEKVKIRPHPRAAELTEEKLKKGAYSLFRNIIAEITANGKKFSTEVALAKGEPGKALTEEELMDKYTHNASFSLLSRNKVEQSIHAIWNLEKLDRMADLTKFIGIESPS